MVKRGGSSTNSCRPREKLLFKIHKIAIIDGLPTFFSAILKLTFYYLLNHKRKKIYYQRVSGFYNALIGKKSYYRPKIND